jgi:7,8-dihydro-6-hydroxymethylpterin-pyrophosphokinase
MSFSSRSFVSNLPPSLHQQKTAADDLGHPDMGATDKSPSPMTLPWPMPVSNDFLNRAASVTTAFLQRALNTFGSHCRGAGYFSVFARARP